MNIGLIYQKNKNLLKSFFLLFTSLIFFTLTTQPINIWFFAFIAFIPLIFFAKDSKNNLKNIFYGSLFVGGGYALFVLWPLTSVNIWWWSGQGFLATEKTGIVWSFIILLSAFLSIITFFPFLWCVKKIKNDFKLLIILPFLWIALEYIRSIVVFGFVWGHIGSSFYTNKYFLQLFGLFKEVGVYTLSFLAVYVNISLFIAIKSKFWKDLDTKNPTGIIRKNKPIFLILLILFFVFVGIFIYGKIIIKKYSEQKNFSSLKVAIVNPKINDLEINTYNGYSTYLDLIEKAILEKPDLIILPESVFPFFIVNEKTNLPIGYENTNSPTKILFSKLENISKTNPKIFFIIGLHTKKENANYSSAVVMQNGKIEDIYNKRQLIPFAENSLNINNKNHFEILSSGSKDKTGLNFTGKNIGILICSEIMIPKLAWPEKNDFIVNISNGGVFDDTRVSAQNKTMATIRAVENRKYVVYVIKSDEANIIDPKGKETKLQKINGGDITIGTVFY